MSTATKTPLRPPRKSDKELRRDRRMAVVVLVVMAGLMALLIWLSNLNGGTTEPIDYWPMMP